MIIPQLSAGEPDADITLFETVAEGRTLTSAERKRAGELLEAWKLSEDRPVEAEHPRFGVILDQMARFGRLMDKRDRLAAGEIAMRAAEAIETHERPGGPGGRVGKSRSGWWGVAWARDLGVVTAFAVAMVIVGVILGHAKRKMRAGAGR